MEGKGREFMKNYFTGVAFVCLRYEQDKEDIIDRYRPIGFQDKLVSKETLVSHSMIYHNNKLKIYQAPDPTDVNWANLHLDKSDKFKRRVTGFLITVLILFLCALAIYAFHIYQENKVSEGNDQQTLQIVSSALAILISLLNFLLCIILQLISAYCKYSTRTEGNIFVAKGLSIARFVNSALISFIIQIFVSNKNKYQTLFGHGGLSDNANYFMISNCFVPALAQLINAEYYALVLLRKIEAKKGQSSLMTQAELNQLYENPQFPIDERYAQLMMTMFTTAFYCPIVPMTIIWSLIGLILQYWIDKYNLIHRYSVKHNMSADLSIGMTEHLEYFLPIQSISTLIFYQYANGGDWGLSSIIGTVFGLLHCFLPMQLINERFFEVERAGANTIDYDEAQKYFITDYSRENPIYKQEARQSHVKKMTVRISNQKTFLRSNTMKTFPTQEFDNNGNPINQNNNYRISNEIKSIFHTQQSPINADHNRLTLLPQRTLDEQEKNSSYNYGFKISEDESKQNRISSSQKRDFFIAIKHVSNETNLGLIEEEVISAASNLQLTSIASKQEKEHQISIPKSLIHQTFHSEKKIESENQKLGKKASMFRLDQKGNEIESTDIQPYGNQQQQTNQLFQTQQENNGVVAHNERESQPKRRLSYEFQSPTQNSIKPSIFSNVQNNADNKMSENKLKYNQNRKNGIGQNNILQNFADTTEDQNSQPQHQIALSTSD